MKRSCLKAKATWKRLSPISKRRKKEVAEYSELRMEYLKPWTTCEVCKEKIATQIHHKAGRRGKQLNNTQDFLKVCMDCHIRIHAQPLWAKKHGYIL